MLDSLYKSYSAIFNERDEENSEEGKESDNENKDSESDDSNETESNSWAYIELIDLVSETQRISWQEVNEMSVIEFCNSISYAIYKNKKKEQSINQYKKTH